MLTHQMNNLHVIRHENNKPLQKKYCSYELSLETLIAPVLITNNNKTSSAAVLTKDLDKVRVRVVIRGNTLEVVVIVGVTLVVSRDVNTNRLTDLNIHLLGKIKFSNWFLQLFKIIKLWFWKYIVVLSGALKQQAVISITKLSPGNGVSFLTTCIFLLTLTQKSKKL